MREKNPLGVEKFLENGSPRPACENSDPVPRRRFSHEKLVRDKTIERLEKRGASVKTRRLGLQDYVVELEKKLVEEAGEVLGTNTAQERLSELADVLEVISALAGAAGSSLSEVERIRQEKILARGSFDKRTYCEYVEVDAAGELARYYTENNYPEVPIK